MYKKSNRQVQFTGYIKTSLLWEDELKGLKQFRFKSKDELEFDSALDKKLRLGHLAEHFVAFELENQSGIDVLAKNVQVIFEKQTLGEFDFLLARDAIQYQIEVVFKFYLYDKSVGTTEIDHWIGPNRNDSLIQKIRKIKEKQFPLVNHDEAKKIFQTHGMNPETIEQRVFFKGKLFVPYGKETKIELLNPNCVSGFYIPFEKLEEFSEFEIYIPSKHDWLVEAHVNVPWLKFEDAVIKISRMIEEKRSPLVWFKSLDGGLEVGFVVFW